MKDSNDNFVLYDSIKKIRLDGEYKGSIISKCRDELNSIIFSDNIVISSGEIKILEGLKVGFEMRDGKKIAFSRKSNYKWEKDFTPLEYSILISKDIMTQYDSGQFSDAFPFSIHLLHTSGLFLNDTKFGINHLDFFKGEILTNPVAVIFNGICISDRVVVDDNGDPVFYDCLIVGRGKNEELSVSYEPLVNVDDKVVEYIVILGIESLKE